MEVENNQNDVQKKEELQDIVDKVFQEILEKYKIMVDHVR